LKLFKVFSSLDKISEKQYADYGQTVTDNYFSGGLWTAGFRALPDIAKLRTRNSKLETLNPKPKPET